MLKGELTEEDAVQKAGGAVVCKSHILMDATLQSEAWDGAPMEVIFEARAAWKDFKAYLKLAGKSVLAAITEDFDSAQRTTLYAAGGFNGEDDPFRTFDRRGPL